MLKSDSKTRYFQQAQVEPLTKVNPFFLPFYSLSSQYIWCIIFCWWRRFKDMVVMFIVYWTSNNPTWGGLNLNTNCKPKSSRSRQVDACTNVVNIFSSNEHGFGDVNISAILNSFQMGYDKRVRPNYGGKLGSKNKHPDGEIVGGEPWPTVPDLRWGNFSCNWIEVCFHWWRSFPALTSHNSINRCLTFTNKMTQITLSYSHENILPSRPSAKNLWTMIFNSILSKHQYGL